MYIASNDIKKYMPHPGWKNYVFPKYFDDVTRVWSNLKWKPCSKDRDRDEISIFFHLSWANIDCLFILFNLIGCLHCLMFSFIWWCHHCQNERPKGGISIVLHLLWQISSFCSLIQRTIPLCQYAQQTRGTEDPFWPFSQRKDLWDINLLNIRLQARWMGPFMGWKGVLTCGHHPWPGRHCPLCTSPAGQSSPWWLCHCQFNAAFHEKCNRTKILSESIQIC